MPRTDRPMLPVLLLSLSLSLSFASCSHRVVSSGATDGGTSPGPDGAARADAMAEPLVLFVEQREGPELAPLWVYDRDGVKRRDLSDGLELGAAYSAIRVSAGGRVLTARSPDLGTRSLPYVPGELPGVSWQRTETQVVVRALVGDSDGDGDGATVRLIGLSAAGKRTFDFEVPGSWDGIHLSPAGRYLFGDAGPKQRAVIDTQTKAVVWTGEAIGALFERDDAALVYATNAAVVFQPLPGGAATTVHYPSELGKGNWVEPEVITLLVGPCVLGYLSL